MNPSIQVISKAKSYTGAPYTVTGELTRSGNRLLCLVYQSFSDSVGSTSSNLSITKWARKNVSKRMKSSPGDANFFSRRRKRKQVSSTRIVWQRLPNTDYSDNSFFHFPWSFSGITWAITIGRKHFCLHRAGIGLNPISFFWLSQKSIVLNSRNDRLFSKISFGIRLFLLNFGGQFKKSTSFYIYYSKAKCMTDNSGNRAVVTFSSKRKPSKTSSTGGWSNQKKRFKWSWSGGSATPGWRQSKNYRNDSPKEMVSWHGSTRFGSTDFCSYRPMQSKVVFSMWVGELSVAFLRYLQESGLPIQQIINQP